MRIKEIVLASLFLTNVAIAEDIPLELKEGTYTVRCQTASSPDYKDLCMVRVDLASGVVELGCMSAPESNTDYFMDITVEATPGQDARIKCYSTDTAGLVSTYSVNTGVIDFTTPEAPLMLGIE